MANRASVLLAVLLGTLLAACGSNAAPQNPVTPPPVAATTTTTVPIKQFHFGQEYVGKGATLVINDPKPYKPSQLATGRDAARHVVLTVRATNTSQQPVHAASLANITATAGDQRATPVEDAADNGAGAPGSMILPGKSLTWRVAFGVPAEPVELTVAVQAGDAMTGETVYFVGRV